MTVYPRTIENGAGEQITFLRRAPAPVGERLELENIVMPGSGPPMHVHYHQVEVLTVQQGRIAFLRPGVPVQFAGPGETVVFEPGEPHKFWNPGEEPLRVTGYIEPADNVAFFLTAMFESQRQRGGGRPGVFEAAYLARRYRSEFGMSEVPAVVQRLVLPVVVVVGRLLGKYRKYAGAPEPVRR